MMNVSWVFLHVSKSQLSFPVVIIWFTSMNKLENHSISKIVLTFHCSLFLWSSASNFKSFFFDHYNILFSQKVRTFWKQNTISWVCAKNNVFFSFCTKLIYLPTQKIIMLNFIWFFLFSFFQVCKNDAFIANVGSPLWH